MATRNRNINKRMNWFDRQFLRAQDFMDEQDHHLDRGRRHNRLMHTAGVVEGLLVTGAVGSNTVTISAGSALDDLGREIVLRTPATLTLTTGSASLDILVLYGESETDPSTDPGVTGNTRITEEPSFISRPAGTSVAHEVLLARAAVNSANGRLTNVTPNPDNTVRVHAAAVVDNDIIVNSVTLKRGTNSAEWPKLSCSAANQAALEKGSLRLDDFTEIFFADNGQIRSFDTNHRIVFNRPSTRMELHELGSIHFLTGSPPFERMRILPDGNIGIGATAPTAKLHVVNQNQDANGNTLILGPTGISAQANLRLGYHADYSWIQSHGSRPLAINPLSNNVGIGTVSPRARLEVSGGAIMPSVGNNNASGIQFPPDPGGGAGDEAFIRYFATGGENTKLMIGINNDPDDSLGLWQAGAERLTIQNGNVGVGTVTPQGRLDVNGGASDTDALFVRAHPATVNQGGVIHHQSAANAWQEVAQGTGSLTDGILTFHYVDRANPATKVRPNVLTLRSDGNVGIGMATPGAHLEISNGWNDWIFLRQQRATDGGGGFHIHNPWRDADGADRNRLEIAYRTSAGVDNWGQFVIHGPTGNVGIGTVTPLFKMHVVAPGGFGIENADGTTQGGGVPIIAQSNSTAIGIINGSGRQAFAINLDGDGGTSAARGIPTLYDKFDGTWRPCISLRLGAVGMGTNNPAASQRLHVVGNVRIDGNLTATGKGGYIMDKFINNLGETLEEGDVVVIGDNQATGRYGVDDRIPIPEVDLAQGVNDTRVCGIVCQASIEEEDVNVEGTVKGKKKQSAKLSQRGSKAKAELRHPRKTAQPEHEATDMTKVAAGQFGFMVTLGAFAHCKVDADIAPIKVGDLLTTSPTKGHAQKVKDPAQAIGAILGKALGALKKGKGTIPVIVTLQ
jgi:hypothetical protein